MERIEGLEFGDGMNNPPLGRPEMEKPPGDPAKAFFAGIEKLKSLPVVKQTVELLEFRGVTASLKSLRE